MKLKIGVTGGIGSGKSYICHLLESQGNIPIYYCDDEAKRLNVESPLIRRGLCRLVGPQVYLADGSLNKPVLISYLFASQEHAQLINALIHPVVLQDFLQWAERQECPVVGLEAALLFEAHYQQALDYTVLVTAPQEIRIQRILSRDHCTLEAAQERIRVQSSEEEKKKWADFQIVNDGLQPLEPQIQSLLGFFQTKIL